MSGNATLLLLMTLTMHLVTGLLYGVWVAPDPPWRRTQPPASTRLRKTCLLGADALESALPGEYERRAVEGAHTLNNFLNILRAI